MGEIDLLISEVATAIEFEKTVQLPSETALYPHLRKEYLQANDSMRQQFISVRAYLNMLENALKTKRNEPFQKLAFEPLVTRAIDAKNAAPVELILKAIIEGLGALSGVSGTNTFERLKTIISEHNKYTDRFSSEVEMARKALEADELMRTVPEWNTRNSQLKIIQDQLSEYQRQTKDINEQIGDLERQVLQHRRPAEELNAELAAYLGRDELHFEVEQTGYRITRNGHPATHLSDGERTAVAFLYFLKSLKGTDFDLANGVVVIDDPVSSLDANSIFSAFGFMKERTAEVGQLFVLTHNFTLFRQVRHWFYHLNRGKKPDKRPARFYMLATEYADSIRSASIDNLDPFLHEYESEYHYLFKRVLEEAQKPLGQALETYYAAPNLARRLLEAFLAFRAPEKSGELYQKFEGIPFDTAKKTRILRFLNSYSHFQQITEGEQDPSILSETPTILKDVLVLIKKLDPEHYQRMVDLVSPPQEETVQ